MRQIFVAEKNIASWILWSWTSFTENTSQRKLFFSSWFLPFCYESFTSGNPLFPVLEISASFKWLHAFESSNSPYFTLLLGLTLWNSQWLPPLASLLSCHKGILSCCVILLWVSMCFPVWIGLCLGNTARPPEKRGTCSRHAAKVSDLYFQIKKKREKTKPKATMEKPQASQLWIAWERELQFQRRME